MQLIQDFNKTVTEIVRSDYRTAEVFRKHGINYCCSGKVSLMEACAERHLDYNLLVKELGEATRNLQLCNSLPFTEWKTDFLIDYIINVHHEYLDLTLPSLETALMLFIEVHKKKHPHLDELLALFQEISALIQVHNKHEEEIIFPYIKQIDSTYRRKEIYGNLFVRTLRKPLSSIEKEQGNIGILLLKVQSLTNNYTIPPNACTNHQVIYHKLREFHNDMVQHKHLENNILFPRALTMEKELLEL